MKRRRPWAPLAGALLAIGCAGPTLAVRRQTSDQAILALRGGDFDRAAALAAGGDDDPHAAIVRAIARYEKTARQLVLDGRTIVAGALEGGQINQRYVHVTLTEAEADLARVDADLAVAARHRGLSMDLCLACWEVDWNGNGRVDDRDRRLFEIEHDEAGDPLPEGDPRRRPTFRFDDGDIPWARAFVSFERAAIDVLLAYDWSDAGRILGRRGRGAEEVRVRLVAPDRIAAARALILAGLDQSDEARRAYLAETDDDREWVPGPRQRSHPVPLAVDAALYDTWAGVVGDVRRIVRGEEALSLADVVELAGARPRRPPPGYLDVGRMLSHPKDIVIDLRSLRRIDEEGSRDEALASIFGEDYTRDGRPSPLPRRLLRMKGEIDRGEEGFERKLRYLLWLN